MPPIRVTSDGTAFMTQLSTRLRAITQPGALATTLLRIGSAQAFEIIAHNATSGRLDYRETCELLTSGDAATAEFDTAWLLQLARVAALRRDTADPAAALAALDLARSRHGLAAFDPGSLQLYAQLLVRLDRDRLPALLDLVELPPTHRWSVRIDAINPFTTAGMSLTEWTDLLADPFTSGGIEPPALAGTAPTPFDRLSATPSTYVDDDSTVTVVMSSYRPGQSIVTAVASILRQSWRNVELLVVDDASPVEFAGVLDEIAGMDGRVRVLRAPANGGTYQVRNLALEHGRGEFVTFQDCDDWAHPRRLELQVAALRADPRLLATRSHTLRAFPDLTFTYLGYPPDRVNASSLLFRRHEVVDLIGYFDAVRKSADVEFTERLQAAAPGSLLDLPPSVPLAICQLRAGSLSRDDAIPGWMNWSRALYRDAYRARNARVRQGSLPPFYGGDPAGRLLPLPDPSWSVTPVPSDQVPSYDVVVLNDWRRGKRHPQGVLDDIRAMIDDGLRVAVAHAETLEPPPKGGYRQSTWEPILQLVESGELTMTHVSQPARARLVVVHDPTTLQFAPDVVPALLAERVAMPVEAHAVRDEGRTYRAADVAANAERLFSRLPVWVPRSARARTLLTASPSVADVSEVDLVTMFDPARLAVHVKRLHGPKPVIGRHVPDHPSHWPARPGDLLRVYPDDDDVDVRIMGGHRTPLRVLGEPALPPNWVSYADGQVDTRAFLAQLDFFVYFDRDDTTTVPGNAVVEAMASGCVVVLPPQFEPVYGDGAVYCGPDQVRDLVGTLHRSPDGYTRQQRRARHRAGDKYGIRAFQAGLRRLLET